MSKAKIFLSVMVFAVTFAPGFLNAQENPQTTATIYVNYLTARGTEDYAQDFAGELKRVLAFHDIKVIQVRETSFYNSQIEFLPLDDDVGTKDIIIRSVVSNVKQLSPILYQGCDDVDCSNKFRVMDLPYYLPEYDQNYMLEILASDITFYAGNYALMNQDYQSATVFLNAANRFLNQPRLWASSFPYPVINAAWAYLQLDDESGASAILTDYLETLEPLDEADKTETQVSFMVETAQLYAATFRYDAAINSIDVAIEIAMNDPESFGAMADFNRELAYLYSLRGQMVLLTYEWDAVLADYNKAIELDPTYADAYFYRGVLFYTQGPREQALEDFERYLELAPEGEHAEEATKYIESIKVELEALGQ